MGPPSTRDPATPALARKEILMHASPARFDMEALENRRLLSVSITSITGTSAVAGTPTIKKLTAAPKSVAAGAKLTIIANNVKDKDGTIFSVHFFQDINGDGTIDGGDTDLGAGTQAGNSWKLDASSLVASAASGDSFK